MFRLIQIISFLLCIHELHAQSTFSTIIDLDYGLDNARGDMFLNGDEIYIISGHNCGENLLDHCGSLATFDKNGNLLTKAMQEGLIILGRNCLLKDEEDFIFSGHLEPPMLGRGVDLIYCDQNFQFNDVYSYHFGDSVGVNNNGLIFHQDAFYIYGQKVDYERDTSYGHIIKIDAQSKELLWEKEFQNGGLNADLFDLQPNPEGNLIFFNQLGRHDDDHNDLIVEIDTSGKVIHSFFLPRESPFQKVARIIVDSEANHYFHHGHNLVESGLSSFPTLHKLNNNFNQIEWDISLPVNFYNRRNYEILDYTQDKNGNIIACGLTRDTYEENEEDRDEHGFLLSFTKSGKLNWLRLYKLVNPFPNTLENKYFSSALDKINVSPETDQIIASGTVAYNKSFSEIKRNTWILSVDSNGCLEGEECEEVIEIDGIRNSRNSLLDLHNQWKYEVDSNPNNLTNTWMKFDPENLDTFGTVDRYRELHVKDGFSPIWRFNGILLRESFGEIWKSYNPPWPSQEYEYLIYDFNLEEGDEFETRNLEDEIFYLIVTKTDSVQIKDGTWRKRLFLKCRDNEQAKERTWIEGIGDINGLLATQTACSNDEHSAELLCFQTSGQVLYEGENAVNCEYVPPTATNTRQKKSIYIYPNPGTDKIRIQNIACSTKVSLSIKDALGHTQMKSFCKNEIDISMLNAGIYFLTVDDGRSVEVQKFVKL